MKLKPETHDEKVKRIVERIQAPMTFAGQPIVDANKLAELLVEMAEDET